MKFNLNDVVILSIIVIILGVFYFFLSLNFTFLGILAIVCLLLVYVYFPTVGLVPLKERIVWRYLSTILITIFSVLTFVALGNYFYADKEVYGNNDHHAIKVEGVKIDDPVGFMLAKNDSTAFFDNRSFRGSIKIESLDTAAVTLRLEQFPHPVYQLTGLNVKKSKLVNNIDKVLALTAKDTVTFSTTSGKSLDFWMEEIDVLPSLWPDARDTVIYKFRNRETNSVQTSKFNLALVTGYGFCGLLDSITNHDIDLNGITLLRANPDNDLKRCERIKEGDTVQYLIDLNGYVAKSSVSDEDRIEKITIGERVFYLSDLTGLNHTVDIKFGENICIGFGDNRTVAFSFDVDTTSSTGRGLFIKYQMPYYQQLHRVDEKIENSLYVTTTLLRNRESANGVGVNLPDNVALFDLFENSNNVNRFTPFNLSYISGSTTETLRVLWEDKEKSKLYSADEYISEVKSASPGTEWLIKIENLRETTKFPAEKMLWVVFLVCVLSVISSNMQFFKFIPGNVNRYTFSYAEHTLHIAMICLIAFRCFLMWRTTVFLPFDNISLFEKESIFINNDYYKHTLGGIACLYIFLYAAKIHVLCYKNVKEDGSGLKDMLAWFVKFARLCYSNWWLFVIIAAIIYVCVGIVPRENTRIILALYVLFSLLVDAIIYAGNKYPTYSKEQNEVSKKVITSVLYQHLGSVINMMITMGGIYAFTHDGGFVIMFATYCLFALVFKAYDCFIKFAHFYHAPNSKTIHGIRISAWIILSILLLAVVLFVLLIWYKEFIVGIVKWPYTLTLACVVAFIVYILFLVQHGEWWRLSKTKLALHAFFLCVIVVFAILLSGERVYDHLGTHTQQRISVLEKNAHELLAITKDNKEESHFLQASHNNWIIEEYVRRSENVSLFGEGGHGYFKIHPQSKAGAMWNAQLSDIVILRYVITEHSKILPILFILLFLALLYCGVRMTTYYRFSKAILIQIPLLLFVQSLLVWMANTQRFVFFGQDFPFISIPNKVLLYYMFLLLAIWVFVAVYESVMFRELANDSGENYLLNQELKYKRFAGFVGYVLVFVIASCYLFRGIDSGSENKHGVYEMKELYDKSAPYVSCIDSLFVNYQDSLIKQDSIFKKDSVSLVLKRDMHPQIYRFNELYGEQIDTLLKHIAYERYKNDPANSDSAEYHFPLRVWKNYVNGGSRNNSYKNLMHVHYNKGYLQISMENHFYDVKLPHYKNNEWKGNIVEDNSVVALSKDTIISTADYVFYSLPKSWLRQGVSPYLLKRKTQNNSGVNIYSIERARFEKLSKTGIDNTISLNNKDAVYVGAKENSENLPNGQHDYWARRVLVNGKYRFVYSHGEELYWMREFAQVAERVQNGRINNPDMASDSVIGADVPITLNRQLTEDVYKIFKESLSGKEKLKFRSRSVVVADGNGHIRCMVDYKNKYVVDPNDNKQIRDINEELYMNYSKMSKYTEESHWFENFNLRHMLGGPGSTQKPLVWNAVASGVDGLPWDSLVLLAIKHQKMNIKDGKKTLVKYNGERMKKNDYKASDELYGDHDITLGHYLAHSSNYYNALMVYLGLHDRAHFSDPKFLKPVRENDTTTVSAFRYISRIPETDSLYNEKYPFIKMGKKGSTMTLNHHITKEDYNRSLLHHQFTTKFELHDSLTPKRVYKDLYPDLLNSKGDATIYMGYTLPAASSLNFNNFSGNSKVKEQLVNSGMRNIALGGVNYWAVTPLHMAEMYGKMISLNKNFRLSFDPKYKNTVEHWGNEKYLGHRVAMFKGMNLFFTQTLKCPSKPGVASATGRELVMSGKDCVGQKDVNGKTYYFYGKTGTSNADGYDGDKDGIADEFRRLAIVISDTNLHENKLAFDSLEKVKFYVMFFTYDYNPTREDFRNTSREIIETVVNSDVFNKYMNASN